MKWDAWLSCFKDFLVVERMRHSKVEKWAEKDWTELLGTVLDRIGDTMGCRVLRKRPNGAASSGEYLNLDAVFVDKVADINPRLGKQWGSFVLPKVVVELENSYEVEKIAYCLCKTLYVRSPLRVLVCYQPNADQVDRLVELLEDIILKGGLMVNDTGDLLIIIGDESMVIDDWKTYFNDFFSVYRWQNNRLEKV